MEEARTSPGRDSPSGFTEEVQDGPCEARPVSFLWRRNLPQLFLFGGLFDEADGLGGVGVVFETENGREFAADDVSD